MSDALTIVEMTETLGLDDPTVVGNDHGRIRGQLLQQRDFQVRPFEVRPGARANYFF